MTDFSEIKYVELSTICKTITGPFVDNESSTSAGPYPSYSSKSIKMIDSYDYDCESIIINKFLNSENKLVNYENSKYSVNTTVFQICSNDSNYSTKYIYYFLMANVNSLSKLYVGSAIKTLTVSNFLKLKIPFPSTDAQKRIVEFIDSINGDQNTTLQNIVELCGTSEVFSILLKEDFGLYASFASWNKNNLFFKEQINNCKEKNSIVYSLFSEKKGSNIPITDVCTFQRGKNILLQDFQEEKNESNIGIFGLKSASNNSISKYYPYNESIEKFVLEKGDLLISLTGNTAGKIYQYNIDEKSFFTSDFVKIVFDKEKVEPEYFYFWYDFENVKNRLEFKGSLVKTLSIEEIEKIEFLTLPMSIQKQISNEIEDYKNNIKSLQEKIDEKKIKAEYFMNDFIESKFINGYCSKTFQEMIMT